ncbi:MAG: hypothetical protein ACRDQ7_02900 [Haloechinothrix sp.]
MRLKTHGPCGLIVEPGRWYVFFASEKVGGLTVSDCGGSRLLAEGPVSLGPGPPITAASAPAPAAPPSAGSPAPRWVVLGGLAALAGGAGAWVVARRGRAGS